MTESQKSLTLGFAFKNIETQQFATIDKAFVPEDKDVNVEFNLNFGISPENKVIRVHTRFEYQSSKGDPFIILAVFCDFSLTEKAWSQVLDETGKKVILPEGFASHLAVLSVGTVRGILHEKTVNTRYNAFILPPVNLSSIINEDVELELNNETT